MRVITFAVPLTGVPEVIKTAIGEGCPLLSWHLQIGSACMLCMQPCKCTHCGMQPYRPRVYSSILR